MALTSRCALRCVGTAVLAAALGARARTEASGSPAEPQGRGVRQWTGLESVRSFRRRLDEEQRRILRSGRPVSLLMSDAARRHRVEGLAVVLRA